MKFVLKVLVLVFLIVLSKLSKDETVALQKPVIESIQANNSLSQNTQPAVLVKEPRMPVSAKFEKSSFQLN